jgi:hypothetical protein
MPVAVTTACACPPVQTVPLKPTSRPRLHLLEEREHRVQDAHHEDRHRQAERAGDRRQYRDQSQGQRQRLGDLPCRLAGPVPSPAAREGVRLVDGQSAGGLAGRQALG